MDKVIRVTIGGIGVGKEVDTIFTVVGSCIAVMLYDKKAKIGGMLHLMLGYAKGAVDNPAKYADTGIPYLIDAMVKNGAASHRLAGAKVSGGGIMFSYNDKDLNVSKANIEAVQSVMKKMNIAIIGSDLGGTFGRRITFNVATGKVRIEAQGQPDKIL